MSSLERTVIGACPNAKCGKTVWSDHGDPWCYECGERFPETFAATLPKLAVSRRERDPQAEGRQPWSLMRRYTDAYMVARTISGAGETIKVVGFAVAACIALAGCAAASQVGTSFGFVAFFFGAAVAVPFYVLGILVSAQGQMLKATLDTAVNSSPLLSQDEVRQIMSLPS